MAASDAVKPNLFIVGAGKCGTTAWHKYLRTHPDIYFSEMKEPTYFGFDLPRMRLVTSLPEYESLFARGRGAKFAGEASGLYLYSTTAAQAISEYNPDAKILLFLRPQEYFLPSVHHQLLYRFAECIEDFETAWRLSGNRPPETISKHWNEPRLLDYRAWGDFLTQVGRFMDFFPREQILVIDFDTWTSDPRSTYLQILDFLGLEDDGRRDFPRVNEAKTYRIKWLGRLLAHPPPIVEGVMRLLRKLAGRSALGIGERASNLIAARGYRTHISPELREEIRRCYESDNRLLDRRLAQSSTDWPGLFPKRRDGA